MMDAKAKFRDGLIRAQEMEEKMSDLLIDLCRPALKVADLPKQDLEEIRQTLLKIQADTERHGQIVKTLLKAGGERTDG